MNEFPATSIADLQTARCGRIADRLAPVGPRFAELTADEAQRLTEREHAFLRRRFEKHEERDGQTSAIRHCLRWLDEETGDWLFLGPRDGDQWFWDVEAERDACVTDLQRKQRNLYIRAKGLS